MSEAKGDLTGRRGGSGTRDRDGPTVVVCQQPPEARRGEEQSPLEPSEKSMALPDF